MGVHPQFFRVLQLKELFRSPEVSSSRMRSLTFPLQFFLPIVMSGKGDSDWLCRACFTAFCVKMKVTRLNLYIEVATFTLRIGHSAVTHRNS